jgi:hypothetical protein
MQGPPKYVAKSIELKVAAASLEGRTVNYVTVTWELHEDRGMAQRGGVYVRLVSKDGSNSGGLQKHGYPGLELLPDDGSTTPRYRATISLLLTEYRASTEYSASRIKLKDVAGNVLSVTFSDDAKDEPQTWVAVVSTNPDVKPPELDVNKITISARPTQPDAPNGETAVSITYVARDDKSGVGKVSYRLLSPQGTSFFE